jgi:hypothetical protein
MSFSSRALRRVLVIGAVVALTGSLGALPVAGQDATGQEAADNAPGPTVPGLTVSRVSGEAFGGEAEFSFGIDIRTTDAATTSPDNQAIIEALRTHDVAAIEDALKAAGVDIAAGTAALESISGEGGPDPEVELPATGGGPIKDSEDELKFKITGSLGSDSFLVAKDLSVVTQGWPGDTGWSRSEATAHEVDGFVFDADKVDSECRADLSGVTGSTDIEEGTYVDENLDDQKAPKHPDPNEELVDAEFTESGGGTTAVFEFSLVVNAQDKDENSITVTGAVEKFKIDVFDDAAPSTPFLSEHFEMSTAQSHCDIHPDPVVQVVEPKFTG